jgi:predicted enzyme related to lactoylglutathione lyase
MAGQMVHYEIHVKDAAKAQEFWGGVFGWQFGDPMPGMDYRMAQIDDNSGAAIAGGESTQSSAKVYLNVDDIDASIGKVRELGGTADDKMEVPGHGWFAAAKDPQGVEFHLWQASSGAA